MKIKLAFTLEKLMTESRLNLSQISHQTGIPYSTLYDWSQNKRPQDFEKLMKLALFLNVSLHYLLFAVEDRATLSTNELIIYDIDVRRVKLID